LGKSTAVESPMIPGGASASTGKEFQAEDAEELLKGYDGSLVLRNAEDISSSGKGKASILQRLVEKNANAIESGRPGSGSSTSWAGRNLQR
jgi:hypothetical protein